MNEKNRVCAIDWSHEKKKTAIFDGNEILKKVPELNEEDIIITENMPSYQVSKFLVKGVNVFRCTPNKTADLREELGWEKTDENDAKIIYELYRREPEAFRETKEDMKLVSLYAGYKNMQGNKVALSNCCWALQDEELDEINKQMKKTEKLLLDKAMKEVDKFSIYTEFLKDIKGVGPSISAGLIAYTGDIGKFSNVSKLWKYFGYDVRDGQAPKKTKGQPSNWHHKARCLCYLISDMFIKHRTPIYRDIYDKEKERQIVRHKNGECERCNKLKIAHKPGHPDAMARRKAIKIFLQHYWIRYRELNGMETNKPYVIDIQKHSNYIQPIDN